MPQALAILVAVEEALVPKQRRCIRPGENRRRGFLDRSISGTGGTVGRGNVSSSWGARRLLRPLVSAARGLPRSAYVGRAGQAIALKLVAELLVALHSAADEALAHRTALDLEVTRDGFTLSAAGARMLEMRDPLMIRGDSPRQMKSP